PCARQVPRDHERPSREEDHIRRAGRRRPDHGEVGRPRRRQLRRAREGGVEAMKRAIAFVALFTATAAMASWYDDYDAGMNAVRKGQWSVAIQKMTAAIAGNSKENDKARTYGAIFISYHPYYYRGIAYYNTGKYEQAIADLERAEGIGEENLGSIEIN